jgi:hypothetical protein
MIEPIGVQVSNTPGSKPFDVLRDCAFKAGNGGEVILLCGSDRIPDFTKMANAVLKRYQSKGELQGTSIKVEEAMDRDSTEAYSATQMRKAAASGNWEEFRAHAPIPEDL